MSRRRPGRQPDDLAPDGPGEPPPYRRPKKGYAVLAARDLTLAVRREVQPEPRPTTKGDRYLVSWAATEDPATLRDTKKLSEGDVLALLEREREAWDGAAPLPEGDIGGRG